MALMAGKSVISLAANTELVQNQHTLILHYICHTVNCSFNLSAGWEVNFNASAQHVPVSASDLPICSANCSLSQYFSSSLSQCI